MFIQVIEGRTSDSEGLRRQYDRWYEELRPGATGFLGSTGGVADDGTAIVLARFESEAAARANSDRPEQGAWWNETEKFYDGEVKFRDSADVELFFGGGSDDAGFVQIIKGSTTERARLQELEQQSVDRLPEFRPEILGMVRAWDADEYVEAVYFTSEAAARGGEGKEPPQDVAALFDQWQSMTGDATFIDLHSPWLRSA